MTVKELKEKLSHFPDELEVVDASLADIISVRLGKWVHTNYPYDLPDKTVVVIE